ncbi:MAG: prepilin-type N-terminal cleavage/methylation domain-containing protein [Elusimicrobiaceae bacterium]|nr:prepilin-type N-terminal cleavage/methylation domain-containing protein [Elusimicrobiaceae bacterium]
MVHQKNDGFTLLELVVVILIIAVLASVAVPQYKMAVARVRYLKLQRTVRKVMQAEQAYFHATGNFTADLDLLDIKFPPWKSERKFLDEEDGHNLALHIGFDGTELLIRNYPDYLEIMMRDEKLPVGFEMFDWHYPDMATNPDVMKAHLIESYCVGSMNNLEATRRTCKAFGAKVDIGDGMWKF